MIVQMNLKVFIKISSMVFEISKGLLNVGTKHLWSKN